MNLPNLYCSYNPSIIKKYAVQIKFRINSINNKLYILYKNRGINYWNN